MKRAPGGYKTKGIQPPSYPPPPPPRPPFLTPVRYPKTIAVGPGLYVKELDKSCSNFVHPCREVFAYLLAPIDLDDMDSENAGRSEQTKRKASLRKWKVKCGARATYSVLITSLLKNGDVQNAEN